MDERNGHSHHSGTINKEGNPEITEIAERREINGIGINEEQISEFNVGINPENHVGLFVNVPLMYVDNEVSQVHSFENKNLARLTLNGQSCERTKGTYAKVPK